MPATSQFVTLGLDMGHLSESFLCPVTACPSSLVQLPLQPVLNSRCNLVGNFLTFFLRYFSSGWSHKESQVLCWKSQPVCKGEDKRSDSFCANSLPSSSLPCRPHKPHASVDGQALLHPTRRYSGFLQHKQCPYTHRKLVSKEDMVKQTVLGSAWCCRCSHPSANHQVVPLWYRVYTQNLVIFYFWASLCQK